MSRENTLSAARALQESAWEAECRHDLDALLAHFAPDAVFRPAGGEPRQGHAAIREMTENFYRSFPGLEIDLLREWTQGESSAVFEFRAHLTDVDGWQSTLDGVCIVEIEEGVFTSVRYYEDAPRPVVLSDS